MISGVELLGGGTRMPAVQAVVTEAIAASEACANLTADTLRFGAKLDDASLAVGAALLARIALDGGGPPPAAEARLDATQLEAALAEEAAMVEADAASARLSELRNQIEVTVANSNPNPNPNRNPNPNPNPNANPNPTQAFMLRMCPSSCGLCSEMEKDEL